MNSRQRKYAKAKKTLQLVASHSGKAAKNRIRADIREIDKVAKYRGKKAKIHDQLQKVLKEHPNIRPEGIRDSRLTEQLYKKLSRKKKITANLLYDSLVKKYNYRDIRQLDELLRINVPETAWYLFASTIYYLNGGLSRQDYAESKLDVKQAGVADTFMHPDKSGSKIRSKLIKLLHGDRVRITSNNPDLIRKGIPIYNRGKFSEYHEDLKRFLIEKSSPISTFLYQNIEQDKDGFIILV
jgi:bisphosphoglycerate-independent phosphoglycerate mutase (AlkP superfamily)